MRSLRLGFVFMKPACAPSRFAMQGERKNKVIARRSGMDNLGDIESTYGKGAMARVRKASSEVAQW